MLWNLAAKSGSYFQLTDGGFDSIEDDGMFEEAMQVDDAVCVLLLLSNEGR